MEEKFEDVEVQIPLHFLVPRNFSEEDIFLAEEWVKQAGDGTSGAQAVSAARLVLAIADAYRREIGIERPSPMLLPPAQGDVYVDYDIEAVKEYLWFVLVQRRRKQLPDVGELALHAAEHFSVVFEGSRPPEAFEVMAQEVIERYRVVRDRLWKEFEQERSQNQSGE